MFQNKEIRDNMLLIAMAIITIVFLVYIFFPFGDGEPQNGKESPLPVKTKKPQKRDNIPSFSPRDHIFYLRLLLS